MGRIRDVVSQYIPFLRGKPSLTREQALKARPVRNPYLTWKKTEEGETAVLIPRREDRFAKFLGRLLRAPAHKEIVLDEVGSEIWELCDGEHTVEAIVLATSKKYKMTRRECETSVGTYLKMLGERKLIGFQIGGRRKK